MVNILQYLKNVGKKLVEKRKSSLRYTIYDNCDICPLSVYIDVICDDKLESLVISGNPDKSVLENVKSDLYFELSSRIVDVTKSDNLKAITNIHKLKTQIRSLSLLYYLASIDEVDPKLFKSFGIYGNSKKSLKTIESKIKGLSIHLSKSLTDYENKYSNVETMKRSDYDSQLALLSKHFGIHLTKKIMLSEYAAYMYEYNKYVETQNNSKTINHGK